jgi:ABC-2 type transport system permease protein
MRSLLALAWVEVVKLLKRPLTWGLLLLLVILLGLRLNGLHKRALQAPPDPAVAAYVVLPEEYRHVAVLPGAFEQARLSYDWLNIAVILLTAMTLGQEFAWGTARTILARGPGRIRMLVAQYVALAAMAGFYLFVLWIASGIFGLFTTRGLEGSVDWPFFGAAFLAQQGAALIRTWAIVLPVIAIAMFLTVWTCNPGLSITLMGATYGLEWLSYGMYGLLWMLVGKVTGIGRSFWQALLTLMPHYNSAIVIHWGHPGRTSQIDWAAIGLAEAQGLPRSPWRSLAVLLACGLFAMMLALWMFRRKDLTP